MVKDEHEGHMSATWYPQALSLSLMVQIHASCHFSLLLQSQRRILPTRRSLQVQTALSSAHGVCGMSHSYRWCFCRTDHTTFDPQSMSLIVFSRSGIRCTTEFGQGPQINTARFLSGYGSLSTRSAISQWRSGEWALTSSLLSSCLWYCSYAFVPIIPHWAEASARPSQGDTGLPWAVANLWRSVKSNTVEIAVQIKGKVRARIMVDADLLFRRWIHYAAQQK